jgi:uncharacterized SAM-binding protein YcdF (DUF218 family)
LGRLHAVDPIVNGIQAQNSRRAEFLSCPTATHLTNRNMNAWMQTIGIDGLKPLLATLVLPPMPWLLLILLGGWWLRRSRPLGRTLLLTGVALAWACWTPAGAEVATRWLLDPPPPLRDPARFVKTTPPPNGPTLIVVLGGGRREAAEYDEVSLNLISIERLRYGIWLSRETGWPVAFTGGLSPGSQGGPSEAAIATRIARDEFRHPLLFAEDRSRDTHENALRTVDMLRTQPVARVVLVTHDEHMPRALRHFHRARDAAGLHFDLLPAPVGITEKGDDWVLGDYLPSALGITRSRYAFREWLAWLVGA